MENNKPKKITFERIMMIIGLVVTLSFQVIIPMTGTTLEALGKSIGDFFYNTYKNGEYLFLYALF